jgi:hypothetical protein
LAYEWHPMRTRGMPVRRVAAPLCRTSVMPGRRDAVRPISIGGLVQGFPDGWDGPLAFGAVIREQRQ